ncbi:hypothetical protein MKD52_08025 [Helicobacter sp. CaF467b]|uniref:hypothetical protein n=1 Tax=Helicobacter sp. CaF467b TaxID=2919923 RepID=UPI001F57A4F1|nr:hypothetical protein [Helicobacter sp. CaF467b]MCI2236772.1 hypothetical protein [Helicobacter sp. CaF467b]
MQKRCIGIQESEFANKEAKYLCKISKNAKQDGELRQERQITTRMPNKNANCLCQFARQGSETRWAKKNGVEMK